MGSFPDLPNPFNILVELDEDIPLCGLPRKVDRSSFSLFFLPVTFDNRPLKPFVLFAVRGGSSSREIGGPGGGVLLKKSASSLASLFGFGLETRRWEKSSRSSFNARGGGGDCLNVDTCGGGVARMTAGAVRLTGSDPLRPVLVKSGEAGSELNNSDKLSFFGWPPVTGASSSSFSSIVVAPLAVSLFEDVEREPAIEVVRGGVRPFIDMVFEGSNGGRPSLPATIALDESSCDALLRRANLACDGEPCPLFLPDD